MSTVELFILAVGLSMDAFAVSVCKGLAMEKANIKKSVIVGLWFGVFQACMPLIGFYLGMQFAGYVTRLAPWIAFILLSLIGGKMIKEAFEAEEEGEQQENQESSLDAGTMCLLAIATSIDAMAVGVSFAMLKIKNLFMAVSMIGITTFCISVAGVKIGNIFGNRYQKKAELAGGIILILLGVKILLEQLGVISV